MAVRLEIHEDERTTVATYAPTTSAVINVEQQGAVPVNNNAGGSVVIEVLKGAPGAQNLYIGETPPENPHEGWVWIDLS